MPFRPFQFQISSQGRNGKNSPPGSQPKVHETHTKFGEIFLEWFVYETPMTMEESAIDGGAFSTAGVTKWTAVIACISMALFYVAILYSPTLILRLPPANSRESFLIRRFICAAISTVASLIACSLILPVSPQSKMFFPFIVDIFEN